VTDARVTDARVTDARVTEEPVTGETPERRAAARLDRLAWNASGVLGGDAALLTAVGPLLDGLRGVRWLVRRRVASGVPGAHQSRRRGTAVEFTEYRPYRQGDDPKGLDWKLLARTDRAYLRLTDDHAVSPTTILLDGSASMAFPSPTLDKWRSALALTLGLTAVAHAGGDPVALVVAAPSRVVRLPPRTRRGVVAEVASALAALLPAASPSLADALPDPGAGGGGRLVVISDLLGAPRSDAGASLVARVAATVAAGTEVLAVHIVAHDELEPSGPAIIATDPEDPSIRRPLLPAVRSAYVAAFAAWRDSVRTDWQRAGARHVMVVTNESVERAVRRICRGA
jgi:uncharacterized protein (DUF58 family)